jgi:hypothetical protein
MRTFCHVLVLIGLLTAPSSRHWLPITTEETFSDTLAAGNSDISPLEMKRNAIRGLISGEITLFEAVKQAGGKLTLDVSPNPDYFHVPDLETLIKKSQVVAVARTYGTPRKQLSDDQQSVVTRYDMLVENLVRATGKFAGIPKLTVEVPGGELPVPTGTVSVVNGPHFDNGVRYLLFLQAKKTAPQGSVGDHFVVTGFHYEGILRIEKTLTARTSASSSARLTEQYDRQPLQSLLAEIRAAN